MNNSFTSGPQSLSSYNRSSSIVDDEYEAPEGPPSYPAPGGRSSFLHQQEYQYGAREVLSGPNESYMPAGSLSNIRPLHPSSTGMENRSSGFYQTSSKGPEIDVVVHENASKNGLGGGDQYGDMKAPGVSGVVHENLSNPSGGDQTSSASGEINQADYVGISLVGKKFKEVNPTAYYVEKDDDLNGFK